MPAARPFGRRAGCAPAGAVAPGPSGSGRERAATGRRRGLTVLVLLVGAVLALAGQGSAQDEPAVHVVDIAGEIDLGLAPFLQRAIDDADADDAAALIVRINTPGGRLDAALQMRSALLDSPVPTVAFVDREAFSAGALIAIAAESIYLAPGSVMGAATPVDGGTGAPADEKVVSAVRSTFRATATERGRDPDVAAAMVDADIEVAGLSEAGKLLTLTVDEALERGYAEGTADDLDDLLAQLGLADARVVTTAPSLAERLVRFITNPVLASLLLTAGIYLVIGDLLSGGVGAAAAIGVTLLGTFFWGHLLAGLSGWEDIALVGVGVVLLLIELVVVPGFGVFGVLGLAGVLGGSFLAMINRDFDFVGSRQLVRAATTVGVSLALLSAAVVGTIVYLTRRGSPPGLVLRTQLGSGAAEPQRAVGGWLGWFGQGGGVLASDRVAEPIEPAPDVEAGAETVRPSLVGHTGTALSDLRPAGIAEVDGHRIDVVTEGDYLAAGSAIEVLRDEGYRRVVRSKRAAP